MSPANAQPALGLHRRVDDVRATAGPSARQAEPPAPVARRRHAATTPGGPSEIDCRVGPATIGIAVAWLAFFALAIAQAFTTSYGEALQNVVMHLQ